MERFFGVLLEQTCGDLPLWLSPVQLRLLPVSDEVIEYCKEIKQEALLMGLRVDVDLSGNRLPKQIRHAEMERIPLMAIVGKREMTNGEISLRARGAGDKGLCTRENLLSLIKTSVANSADVVDIDFSTWIKK